MEKKTDQGTLYSDAMFLRTELARGTDEKSGITYEISQNVDGHLLVHSDKTDNTFVFSWESIINIAIDNGIDQPI